MTLSKPQTVKNLIQWVEERIAKCEKTLKILEDAELRHPKHIECIHACIGIFAVYAVYLGS
jgi:hypothetical protein